MCPIFESPSSSLGSRVKAVGGAMPALPNMIAMGAGAEGPERSKNRDVRNKRKALGASVPHEPSGTPSATSTSKRPARRKSLGIEGFRWFGVLWV